jgi:hypothetical protein
VIRSLADHQAPLAITPGGRLGLMKPRFEISRRHEAGVPRDDTKPMRPVAINVLPPPSQPGYVLAHASREG